MNNVSKIEKVTNELKETFSNNFCLAKWLQASLYLHRGETHSCYHPPPHKIPVDGLTNPASLHNTPHKIQERRLMLNNQRPPGCQYCWNIEDLEGEHLSDRKIKSTGLYNKIKVKEILNNPVSNNISPTRLEISFSDECNFKCGYCHPKHSSSYYNEIKKFGPVETVTTHQCYLDFEKVEENNNPYVDAFWEWWPKLSNDLTVLRITGGEPLLHASTMRLLQELETNPKPNLELSINSNLGMSTRHVEKVSNQVKILLDNNCIKSFVMYTSMDTWGERAEYIRTGLDCSLWEKNQDTYIRITKQPVSHMCTFNILSVTSFKTYLEKVLYWREKYKDIIEYDGINNLVEENIRIDIPYLKEPLQYNMLLLPKQEYIKYFDELVDFAKINLTEIEFEKIKRLRDYFYQADVANISEGRKNFYNWFVELDKRRNTNFVNTFPEMENFWKQCQTLS